jgi:3-dehydroquinate dehydratase / shikimate dehydrogenase
VTVTGADTEAMRAARTAAEVYADLVELRLDSMAQPDPDGTLAGRQKPVIVTCRPRREGGMFDGPEEERLRILCRAQTLGAEFVDVEWDAPVERFLHRRGGKGVIVSRHIFDRTPADAPALLDDLLMRGAEVGKLAVMTERLADLRTLLHAVRPDASSVLIGMGPCGVATRVLGRRFGSRWTYAGPSVAPGQLPVSRLLDEFQFRRIEPDADVYGVIGRPVINSLSPAMHNAGFTARGLNAVYVPLETADLAGLRAVAADLNVKGLSVTIPFKTDVLPLLDQVDETAAASGAVNTIAIRDGRWIGMNTDADGFLEPLRARVPELRGRRALILGAGGAARGVGLALRQQGATVAIAARRGDASRQVAAAIGCEVAEWPPAQRSWDLLVNATPAGSRAQPGLPCDVRFDNGERGVVYDLVYDPAPTELMQAAEAAGHTVLGGLDMLVAQAERQFEIWTGGRPPRGLFARAAADAIRSRET